MPKRTLPLPTPPPVQIFFRCLDDTSQPPGYVGDWPVAGSIYSGRILLHHESKVPRVHLDGFHAEHPWGAFAVERFILLARVCLN